jgi:Polyketide cyclase / dehydrase and lipid transport
MKVELTQSVLFSAPPEQVWALLTDINQMSTFSGWGPIPGIAEARWIKGSGEVGSVRLVSNRDGTKHQEEVMTLERPTQIEDRVFALESPLRFMVRDVRDGFSLAPEGQGTRLYRTFTFELRSALWWPLAMGIRAMMERAVAGHHAALASRL